MARPKGLKNADSKSVVARVAAPEVPVAESVSQVDPPLAPAALHEPANIAPFDTCRYHEEFPPRVFKKNEVVPAGWYESQSPLKQWWTMDDYGKWSRKDK
jgi:hypothetical protein